MRRRRLPLYAAAFGLPALVLGTAASAASTVQTDAQCLVLSNALAKASQDQNAQRELFAAHFYYLGRLRVEIGNDKLPGAIAEAEKSISPALAGKSMQACGAALQAAETDAEQAGKSLHPTPAAPAK